ncbi:MAG: PAS-domain containing protein [Pseudomonadota bacterium]
MVLAVVFGLLAVGAGYACLGLSRRAAEERRRREDLVQGITIRADGEQIRDFSPGAATLPGIEANASLFDVFSATLVDGREEALVALDILVDRGLPMRLLVSDQSGAPWELVGQPRGGELVITMHDASLMLTELRKSQRRISAREQALEEGMSERQVMSALLGSGAAIAWQRNGEGAIQWSAGTVASRLGQVLATQTTALIGARTAEQVPDDTGIIRSRLEILPTGEVEPLPLQIMEIPTGDGDIVGLATDATVAAQAERTLGRFVQTMTETFAHLTAGLAIFDRNQKLVLFNPAFAQLLQLDPAWLANRPSLRDIIDALRANQRIPETGDYHGWRKRLLSLFDNTERADLDEIWHLADGTNIKVLARPHPHRSLAFVFDDISDRIRLEQRYRQSIDLQEATLNRLQEGLAVFGADGRLRILNASFTQIFGIDTALLQPGMHVREIVRLIGDMTVETDLWDKVTTAVTADETRSPWAERLTLGSSRILRLRLAPLPGGDTMLVIADITDSERFAVALSERNSALESAEEMRTAVLDQISHRLRTPLNTIFGFGQLLNDPRFGSLTERQREYAAGILEASGQLLDTIDEVTDLASLQPGEAAETMREPTLDETVELARTLIEKRAGEAGVTLRTELAGGDVRVACDTGTLRQIAFNMAAGAVQRAAVGSTVRIVTTPPSGDGVTISVIEQLRDGVELTLDAEQSRSLPPAAAQQGRDTAASLEVTARMVEAQGGRFSYDPSTPSGTAGSGASRPGGASRQMSASAHLPLATAAIDDAEAMPLSRALPS